jgi:DNA-directed RNA polymerase II subunit RPB2
MQEEESIKISKEFDKENISWKIIDQYFKDNPTSLVSHHLESYNEFTKNGIRRIFYENNPIRFIEREDESSNTENRNECMLYLGGKDGSKIYYGRPVIYDDNNAHYMFPNEARLRNMTYGTTIHYDVDVIFKIAEPAESGVGTEIKVTTATLERILLGRFPIMLQSDLCILSTLNKDVRFKYE